MLDVGWVSEALRNCESSDLDFMNPAGSNSSQSEFSSIDHRIKYFVRGSTKQNFGDYLPEIFFREMLTFPRVSADVYRLVGSVIEEKWIRRDLRQTNGFAPGRIAYWCCGARNPIALSASTRQHCLFYGVRGPL